MVRIRFSTEAGCGRQGWRERRIQGRGYGTESEGGWARRTRGPDYGECVSGDTSKDAEVEPERREEPERR